MKRVISLSSATALLSVMLTTSVAPAFAASSLFRCELGGELQASTLARSQEEVDFYKRNYDAACIRVDLVPGEAG